MITFILVILALGLLSWLLFGRKKGKPEVQQQSQPLEDFSSSFGPAVKEFTITTPSNYNQGTYLDEFKGRAEGLPTTYYYNENLTSKNFPNPTYRLEPGKKYKVRIFPILKRVTSEDCLAFLCKQGAKLVGAQGLVVGYDQKKEEFPKGKYIVFFDEKKNLPLLDGDHRVPRVDACSDGDFGFNLGYFEDDCSEGHCLFCLSDSEK